MTEPLNLAEELKEHLIDHDGQLGLVRAYDPRIPMLRDFVQTNTQVPREVHRSFQGFTYGMLGNDQVGDCVIAAIYHALMHVYHVLGMPVPNPDVLTRFVLETYSAITGYDPKQTASDGSNPTDQGTDPTQAWAYWRDSGIPLPDGSRHKILGVVQILPHDGVNLRRAIYEFDGAGLSLAMPMAWQNARVWDVGGDPSTGEWQPGGWGGHEVYGVSFDANNIAVLTWGGVKLLTWRAWGTYGDVALTQVTQDQIGKGGVSETGLNLAALKRDLVLL